MDTVNFDINIFYSEEDRGGFMTAYQEILEAISVLSEEDQEELFELIRKRRIENRRSQIATNAQAVLQAVDEGKVVKGSFADIKAYLLEDEEE